MGTSAPRNGAAGTEPAIVRCAPDGHLENGGAQGRAQAVLAEEVGLSQSERLAVAIGRNPHCAQLRAQAAEPFLDAALTGRTLHVDDRYLSKAHPRMKYERRADSDRSSNHWGQMKLLESEMKCFLDFIADKPSSPSTPGSHLVVYAGAAPGAHILALLQRFPSCRFELYDPASFDQRLVDFAASAEGSDKVTLVNTFFDDDQARKIAAKCRPGVFFSDIRTADPSQMEFAEVEGYVGKDMAKQKEWVRILRPQLSVLKFRLPWSPGTTWYLRGKVLVQAFPPCTSTESRLLVPLEALDEPEVAYDQEEYQEQFMHHNTVTRACIYDHSVEVPGLDHCFDCSALVQTVQRFLELRPLLSNVNALDSHPTTAAVSAEDVAAEISALVADLGQSKRSLKSRYHVSSSRHGGRQFAKRRYYDSQGNDQFSEQPAQKKLAGPLRATM